MGEFTSYITFVCRDCKVWTDIWNSGGSSKINVTSRVGISYLNEFRMRPTDTLWVDYD